MTEIKCQNPKCNIKLGEISKTGMIYHKHNTGIFGESDHTDISCATIDWMWFRCKCGLNAVYSKEGWETTLSQSVFNYG